ncbi:MAG: hypothetical protein QOJ64_1965 [Acidobacteriota bacterium]|jgi:hypothetical protein|nr:hypothetical protein [Acidobacteriota bacterium]
MKASKIIPAMFLLLGVVSCHGQSADPKKDIVGIWKSTDNKHMLLNLRADGTCLRTYAYLAPSDFEEGTYTLTPDPSGINILTLNLRRRAFGGDERSTRSFEAAVYPDELILGVGAAEVRLARAPKQNAP